MPLKASDVEVFNTLKRRAARLLAKGVLSHNQAAAVLGCSRQVLDKWAGDPAFIALMREFAVDEEKDLVALLYDGMNHAVLALIEACHAVDAKQRPDHKTRMAAAAQLLDRAGKPGPIPEVTQVTSDMRSVTADLQNPLIKRLMAANEVPLLGYEPDEPGISESPGELADGLPDIREQPGSLLQGDTGGEPVGEATPST